MPQQQLRGGPRGSLGVLLGNGNGSFPPAVTDDPDRGAVISRAVADLNGDGKLDVALSSPLGIFLGHGDGTFQPFTAVYPASGAFQVFVADMNHDGKPDPVGVNGSRSGSTQGKLVTFTAKISSPTAMPTGPVTFTLRNTGLGTAQLSGGKAKFTISTLPVGSAKTTVTYYGSSNVATSSASLTQTVQQKRFVKKGAAGFSRPWSKARSQIQPLSVWAPFLSCRAIGGRPITAAIQALELRTGPRGK